jgi:hypothetical protein
MQTSHGYIFCILQHFVTKFCNFTDFNKFFTGIYFFLSKSKISLTCKLSIASMNQALGRRPRASPLPSPDVLADVVDLKLSNIKRQEDVEW